MTIQSIVPHISCYCRPEEVEEALAAGYQQVFFNNSNGLVKHHKLRGNNRYVRLNVQSLPPEAKAAGVVEETRVDLPVDMRFLPAGKIPYKLYEQIEAFFKKVIQLRGAALEAMIFIHWSEEKGYYLWVPKQSVAAASVNYQTEGMPSDTIVVNVH